LFGLMRMLIRVAWLAIIVLGLRRAFELTQGGIEAMAENIEAGDEPAPVGSIRRVHDALHKIGGSESTEHQQ